MAFGIDFGAADDNRDPQHGARRLLHHGNRHSVRLNQRRQRQQEWWRRRVTGAGGTEGSPAGALTAIIGGLGSRTRVVSEEISSEQQQQQPEGGGGSGGGEAKAKADAKAAAAAAGGMEQVDSEPRVTKFNFTSITQAAAAGGSSDPGGEGYIRLPLYDVWVSVCVRVCGGLVVCAFVGGGRCGWLVFGSTARMLAC